jgi:hypothetical protein
MDHTGLTLTALVFAVWPFHYFSLQFEMPTMQNTGSQQLHSKVVQRLAMRVHVLCRVPGHQQCDVSALKCLL